MTAQTLIDTLEKLLVLHNQLLETSQEKTAAIEENDMKKLNNLLREEQKHVTAIQIADQSREKITEQLLNRKDASISEVADSLSGQEKETLAELQEKLKAVIAELKNSNALNQQLLEYSMQFVNMSLDILSPEENTPNYSKTQNEGFEQPGGGRSIFDSKA